jgi:hypothetical protein
MVEITVSPSDMVFVNDAANELEATFSDLSGRLVEDKPGDFKVACFQVAYEIHVKLGTNQFAVYKLLRDRILHSSMSDVIEEYNILNSVYILGIKEASERFNNILADFKSKREIA